MTYYKNNKQSHETGKVRINANYVYNKNIPQIRLND